MHQGPWDGAGERGWRGRVGWVSRTDGVLETQTVEESHGGRDWEVDRLDEWRWEIRGEWETGDTVLDLATPPDGPMWLERGGETPRGRGAGRTDLPR